MRGDMGWRKSSYSSTGGCAEVAVVPDVIAWRTSSRSNGDACAEVGQGGQGGAGVLMRDTKDRGGPVLAFDAAAWAAFLAMVRSA